MDKRSKSTCVTKFKHVFSDSHFVILMQIIDFSCKDSSNLRVQLHSSGAKLLFVKNSLAKIAVSGTKFEYLASEFKNSVAVAYSNDIVSLARVVCGFSKANNSSVVILRSGSSDGAISYDDLDVYSKLPSLRDLQYQVVGVLQNFLYTNFVGLFSSFKSSLLLTLKATTKSLD